MTITELQNAIWALVDKNGLDAREVGIGVMPNGSPGKVPTRITAVELNTEFGWPVVVVRFDNPHG